MHIELSILTPTIPSRKEQLSKLSEKIAKQSNDLAVEHLSFADNRTRTIGAKRQSLLDIARGEYIAFVDDDDDIEPDYVSEILLAIKQGPDVITFEQNSYYNGAFSKVVFGLNNRDEPFQPNGITLRAPWHVCVWKRELVKTCQFGESNYGEDIIWSRQARARIKTSLHIDKTLCTYRHDAALTAAPESVRV
jgi:glycosyltransferase involved in cell wall biosynthesis